MTSEILARARGGDPAVIAVLLNHIMKSQGIEAKAAKRDRQLHVMLESVKPLNQRAIVEFIQKSVQSLDGGSIDSVIIYSRRRGESAVHWREAAPIQKSDSWANGDRSGDFEANDSGADVELSLPENNSTPATNVIVEMADGAMMSIAAPMPPDSSPTNPFSTQPMNLSDPPEVAPPSPEAASAPPNSSLMEEDPTPDAALTPGDRDSIDIDSPEPELALDDETAEWLQRPEAVIYVVFAVIVTLWQLYLDIVAAESADDPLSGRRLARRLGVNSSTISRRKERPDFVLWSQDLDPDGVGWRYENGFFVPQNSPNYEEENSEGLA